MESNVVNFISYRFEKYLKKEGFIVKKDANDNIKIAIKIKSTS